MSWDVAGNGSSGQFDGGSSIGAGERLKFGHPAQLAESNVIGFIRIRAKNLEEAKNFLQGIPVYMAGGHGRSERTTQRMRK